MKDYPKLEYLMTYRADLKAPVQIGKGPFGNRAIYDVAVGQGRTLPNAVEYRVFKVDNPVSETSAESTRNE